MTFNSIPGRDAYATFAGYLFQVNGTILRWLELASADRLELEAGEDIDLVQGASAKGDSEKHRVMEQLKRKPCNTIVAAEPSEWTHLSPRSAFTEGKK
jgi:hypothetical protein